MDKSMMSGNARGGIYIHKGNDIYVADYDKDQLFSQSEYELKNKFVNALITCYRTGALVNVRRHLAVSNVTNPPEKCVFEWNNETISLAEAEIVIKTNNSGYYFKTSLIYNVFKFDYKPDAELIFSILSQFCPT